jgi:hypothetical protein
MYKIKYDNYEFECTYNHILSFFNNGKIINMPLNKFIKNKYKNYKLYRKIKNEILLIDNFEIEHIGKKKFYGFEIDGNHLFKIENDLVTHNTGMIASQTFHGKEGGLVSMGGNTGDNTLLFANKGEALLQDETYQNLVKKINGENNTNSTPIYIQNFYSYSNNAEQLREELIELARTEATR